MRKYIFLAVAFLVIGFTAQAQNYMVVNTEKVFKSIDAYNSAIESLDKLGEQYQKTIDDAFNQLETTYNTYQAQKSGLSVTARQQREDQIINREKEILAQQERYFGQEGDLMKKRVEVIKPIQDRVFQAIDQYAQNNGFQMVLDIASNPSVLYYSPSVDKTDEIIRIVK